MLDVAGGGQGRGTGRERRRHLDSHPNDGSRPCVCVLAAAAESVMTRPRGAGARRGPERPPSKRLARPAPGEQAPSHRPSQRARRKARPHRNARSSVLRGLLASLRRAHPQPGRQPPSSTIQSRRERVPAARGGGEEPGLGHPAGRGGARRASRRPRPGCHRNPKEGSGATDHPATPSRARAEPSKAQGTQRRHAALWQRGAWYIRGGGEVVHACAGHRGQHDVELPPAMGLSGTHPT